MTDEIPPTGPEPPTREEPPAAPGGESPAPEPVRAAVQPAAAPRGSALWAPILLALLVFGLYASTLGHGFVYDDETQILRNPHLRSARYVPGYFTRDVWSHQSPLSGGKGTARTLYYRPWFLLSYFAQYQAFGTQPGPWHGVNLLLHLAFVLLGWRVLLRLGLPPLASFLGAAVVAAHPVNTEPVNWLAGQCDLWMATAFAASFLFFLRWRDRGSTADAVCAMAAYVVSLLSKETGIVLFVLPLAHVSLFPRRPVLGRPWLPVAFAALAAAYAVVRTLVVGVPPSPSDGTFGSLALLVPSVLGKYLCLLAFPHPLVAVYPKLAGLSPLYLVPGALLLGGAALLTAMAVSRPRWRTAFLLVLLLLVPLAPTLDFGGLSQSLLAERYLYLSTLGFGGLAALAAAALAMRVLPGRSWVAAAPFALLLPVASAKLLSRNLVWKDELTMTRVTSRDEPRSHVIRYNYALILAKTGRHDEAEAEFRALISDFPTFPQGFSLYGTLLAEMGRREEAIRAWESALSLDPWLPFPARKLALEMERRGRWKLAEQYYRMFVHNALPEQAREKEEALRKLRFLQGKTQ